MKKLFFLGLFIGLCGLFLGIHPTMAVVLGDCVCPLPGTAGIATGVTQEQCQQKEVTDNPNLSDTDATNDLEPFSCAWNKRQEGICACTWNEKTGSGASQKTEAKSSSVVGSKGDCTLKGIKENVLNAPNLNIINYTCNWSAKNTGCYCDVQKANTSGVVTAEFRKGVGEANCKEGQEGDALTGIDVFTNCFYVDNTTASEGEPGKSGGSTGDVSGGVSGGSSGGSFSAAQGPAAYTGVGNVNNGTKVFLGNPLGDPNIKIVDIIGRVIKSALGVMGSLAFLAFVYGGFLWLIAAGNDEKIKKGKDSMVWATIGIFVIFSAYGIMSLFFNTIGATQGAASTGSNGSSGASSESSSETAPGVGNTATTGGSTAGSTASVPACTDATCCKDNKPISPTPNGCDLCAETKGSTWKCQDQTKFDCGGDSKVTGLCDKAGNDGSNIVCMDTTACKEKTAKTTVVTESCKPTNGEAKKPANLCGSIKLEAVSAGNRNEWCKKWLSCTYSAPIDKCIPTENTLVSYCTSYKSKIACEKTNGFCAWK